MAATKTATMLWLGEIGSRLGVNKFTKEGHALGRKYTLVLNGQWTDLDKICEQILTGGSGEGYDLLDMITALPNFSLQARDILMPSGVKAYARTPKLENTGDGDKGILTLLFEEGLQEGTGGAGGFPVGPSLNDWQAFSSVASNDKVPANSSYRLVFEPNDVELGYGLPFRKGYKWDLTTQAPNLAAYTFPSPTGYDDASGVQAVATHPSELLAALGYASDNISTLAVCNIWREGSITEQQRGALFCYLNDGAGATSTIAEQRASRGMRAYVLRILRGETSYRYFLPHVSVIRRYRSPPVVPGYFPLPGEISLAGAKGAPPPWTNAPEAMYVQGATDPDAVNYTYWSTGPQVEFVGDQWQVEVQWNAFVDLDTNMYENPTQAGANPDDPESLE